MGVRGAGPEVASVSCHCPVTMLGNLRARNPAPTPSHTHTGAAGQRPDGVGGACGPALGLRTQDPSGTRTRRSRLPTPQSRRLPPEPVARYCCNLRTKAGGEEGARRGGDEIPLSAVPLPPGSDPRLPRTRPGLRLALPFDPRLVEPRAPQPRPSPALTLPRARGQSSGHPDRTVTTP